MPIILSANINIPIIICFNVPQKVAPEPDASYRHQWDSSIIVTGYLNTLLERICKVSLNLVGTNSVLKHSPNFQYFQVGALGRPFQKFDVSLLYLSKSSFDFLFGIILTIWPLNLSPEGIWPVHVDNSDFQLSLKMSTLEQGLHFWGSSWWFLGRS